MKPHSSPEERYAELIRRARELSLLESCEELLSWDEDTFMPRGGVTNRGEQQALLAGIRHGRATDPELGELLASLESDASKDTESPLSVNVRELRRRHDRIARIPLDLFQETARTVALAEEEWGVAFRDDDFPRFEPWLEKIVRLKREEARAIGFSGEAYDALLDEYEPGATSAELEALFAELRPELGTLLARIGRSRRKPKRALLGRDFPVDRQKIFGEAVATALGFDFHAGRLDVTIHPFFSRIGRGDCRIATLYAADSFGKGLFAIIHEVGHALYEQGLDPAHDGTPLGEAPSLGLHESQARLWENLVGRSRPFWTHFFPLAREIFHGSLRGVNLDDFHFALNAAGPTLIRAQADQVTYNLHILVRFEIERALISGRLEARDVPAAWNKSYGRHLGIVPSTDREGSLQDGHWGAGMFGYFPVYTLGDVWGAQLHEKASKDLPALGEDIAKGSFAGLLGWLRENVHRHGSRWPAQKIVERATGKPVSIRPLMEHLGTRYGELYGV